MGKREFDLTSATLPGEWVVQRLEEMGETFRWSEYKP